MTPGELVRILETHRPTVVFAGPLASPRLWVSACEALPAPLVTAWMALTGTPVIDGIGTTEALHIFLSNRPDAVRPGSSGTPVRGYEVRLVDEEGRDVAPGTQGHLLVRGESIAKG